jgi:NAD(P)-dependent dehydrogenase (short-subunit alcohol dehydrogenase family)
MRNLQDKRVVVLGGSSGIGLAAAKFAASLGAEVIIGGRNERKLRALANENISRARMERVDATDRAQLDAFFERIGNYDHLVLSLSAGPAGAGPIRTLSLDELRTGFEGKFWPYLMALQAALSGRRLRDSITMVGAASAGAPLPGAAGFAAISGALESMIPALAVELKPLRVNAVSPGVVDTQFWHALPEEQRSTMFAKYASATLVGRIATPEDIGQAIVSLISNAYVTGVVLKVDGGLTLTGA